MSWTICYFRFDTNCYMNEVFAVTKLNAAIITKYFFLNRVRGFWASWLFIIQFYVCQCNDITYLQGYCFDTLTLCYCFDTLTLLITRQKSWESSSKFHCVVTFKTYVKYLCQLNLGFNSAQTSNFQLLFMFSEIYWCWLIKC